MEQSYKHKKIRILIVTALLVMTLAFTFQHTNVFQTQVFHASTETTELMISNTSYGYGISDPRDPRFYNIMLEEDALMFKSCKDVTKAASINHSKISLADRVSGTYNIGEDIRAIVTLYDGYGKRKHSGGDQLRATIENKVLKASAPCVVTDNNDGTQAVTCEALWSGTSTIQVTLAYTREAITAIYRIRTQVLSTRYIGLKFRSGSYEETTICHPNATHLLKLTNYTDVCDMTEVNFGMSFYCGKPQNKHLQCQDMQLVEAVNIPAPELQFTGCENILLERGQQTLKQNLAVNVRNKNGDSPHSIIEKPSIPCAKYNITLLWLSREPTGFFYDGKWNLRNCLGFQQNYYQTCLKNRRLYVFGDSTSRAWYKTILKRFQCRQTTEKWQFEKWKKDSECYNRQINFKVGWYPQAQPFFARTWDDMRAALYSISGRIDRIPRKERAIIVIHSYMHMVAFHHSVFKQKMEIIRESVDKFLRNNKQSIVMIKAPHTYEDTPAGKYRLSDYFGYVYSKILYEVFEGLHDRVVLLNNRDTTIAQHVEWNHPPKNIINAMIDQMLSYACIMK
ncbi:NXPE family member 4-like [Mercenaria mercenaria]|uniref:NXPE family member 4-like n=1 Tax=Mercenaria mercenaria TaxID=6596 RepID=UPI00234F7BBB|nr:NXPE family member 4-like [Mercenaria mercenaria]